MKMFIVGGILFLLSCYSCRGAELDPYQLTMTERYDEALNILNEQEENTPKYYYLKMLCESALFQRDEGIKSARKLLSFDNLPQRYSDIAKLVEHELSNTKIDGLEHVSRKMKDSERRLGLGRGGRKVQKVQAETIAMLDYLIERLEQQQGGGSGSEKCPGEKMVPSKSNDADKPANDSLVKGATSPGEVDKRKLTNKGGWGNLPEKEQAKARQYAEEKYPPHYRKIIQEYSKKMAERKRK